jgi:hypothetical protein
MWKRLTLTEKRIALGLLLLLVLWVLWDTIPRIPENAGAREERELMWGVMRYLTNPNVSEFERMRREREIQDILEEADRQSRQR